MKERKKGRDEETSPFPLERGKSEPPPRPRSVPPSDLTTSGERTGPFLLERGKSSPENPIADADPPDDADAPVPSAAPPAASVRLTRASRVARRRVALTLVLHSIVLGAMAAISIVRWSKGLATPPELALAVLWGGVALIHLRAGTRFGRLGRKEARDGALLVGALTDLRTVIVLKAVFLFLALTLLCFSLSMVISLVASI